MSDIREMGPIDWLVIEFDSPLPSGATALRVLHSPTGQFVASRYARFTTRAHPGVQAPLGWTLSSASIDDLRTQLSSPENLLELAEVSRWLGGELSCVAEEA